MYCTRYSCQTSAKLDVSRQIFENYLNFMKIRSVGAELFHADGRTDRHTDMTKLIAAFRNLAKAHTKCMFCCTLGLRDRI